jgi:hypothetical protein
MFSSSVVPVTVLGRRLGLQWTFDAMIAAEQLWGFPLDKKLFAATLVEYAKKNGVFALQRALGYCMLQSAENPPSLKDLGRMPEAEVTSFLLAVNKALDLGVNGPLKDAANEAAKKNAVQEEPAANVSPGTGEPRLSRRSTAAGSRRRNSSGSRPLNSA